MQAGQQVSTSLQQCYDQRASRWNQPEAREQGDTLRAPATALRSVKRAWLLPQGLGHRQGRLQRHVQHFGGCRHHLVQHRRQHM